MSGNKTILMMGTALPALLGPMTAAERRHGRYMRAPDGHDADDGGFADFEKAGEVETGKPAIETNIPEAEKPVEKPDDKKKGGGSGKPPREAKPAGAAKPDAKADAKAGAAKPAAAAAEKAKGAGKLDDNDEPDAGDDAPGEGDEEDEEEEEEPPKPKKKASDRIRELTAGRRSDRRVIEQLSSRLDAIEKGGLPGGGNGGNGAGTGKAAPDPTDAAKYPLGHLDDRYIEDKLEWLADQKAGSQADAVLQRQQESERQHQAEQAREKLLEKVDDLSSRGSELYDDFQDSVIESGMRGDWRLDQPTFEAAHEAENGAQILYELSQDKKEAARVASLSPYQQMRFVMDRDAEISSKAKPRTKPGAGAPPSTKTKGANSSHRINPATDNLDDFEKAWVADAKG